MDDDGSGTISSSEVAKMLNELGIDVSPKVVQAVMRSSDVSGDGQIDFEEFLAAVTSKIKVRSWIQFMESFSNFQLSTVKADVQLMLSKIDNNPEKVVSWGMWFCKKFGEVRRTNKIF